MRPTLVAAAMCWLAGCGAVDDAAWGARAAPIVGGEATDAFPEVGALLHGGDFLCSVVLIGGRVALTAAHCTYGFENDLAPLRVRFDASIPPDEPEAGVAIEALRTHPDYSTNPSSDIAVIVLAADPGIPPVPWSSIPLDANVIGEPLTLVGLGDTVLDDVGAPRRRRVEVSLDELTTTHLRWDGVAGGSCHGDSGGAAFADLGAGPVLLGVLSEGDPSCEGWGSATRSDVFASFIDDPGSAGDDDDDATGGLLTGDDDDALPPPRACAQVGAVPSFGGWLLALLWSRRRCGARRSRSADPESAGAATSSGSSRPLRPQRRVGGLPRP